MTGYELRTGPYPLGAHSIADGIQVSFVSKSENCGIIFYDRESGKRIKKIPFTPEERVGSIRYKWVPRMNAAQVSYQFYEDGRIVPDPFARVFTDNTPFGKKRDKKLMKAAFLTEDFDWEGTKPPRIPYEESICYLLHVRGFTRHPSSGVAHRGSFLGVAEKVPYLKKLGITTVELQPAYEFQELEPEEEDKPSASGLPAEFRRTEYMDAAGKRQKAPGINYWGYLKGYYYAPKGGFSSMGDPVTEFRQMVKAFHQSGMEVIMQFYFPDDVPAREIPDILLHWVLEYQVDGFHVFGEKLPMELIAEEAGLADVKLWFSQPEADRLSGLDCPGERRIALYRDDFLYDMRRFLKGDSDMLQSAMYHMRSNPEKMGRINYLSNYYGFTMMDMVSYDEKHNEANGEGNRDGNDYNQSWNCGVEGPSRKKQVTELRTRQYKNALSMLFLSQATPLLFMGDEFGNSQKGNNNPYCQDNEITWLNWGDLNRNRELYDFAAGLIRLRRSHPILHMKKELRIMDSLSCGYPDLSYHGTLAWRPSTEHYDRQIGIMYCGKYAKKEDGQEDNFFYAAFNMHWEPHEFALPRLPKELEWDLLFITKDDSEETAQQPCQSERLTVESGLIRKLPPRTTAVYVSREKVS